MPVTLEHHTTRLRLCACGRCVVLWNKHARVCLSGDINEGTAQDAEEVLEASRWATPSKPAGVHEHFFQPL